MKKDRSDNYRDEDLGKIELEKVSMLSLIVDRDGRTQTELAAECRKYRLGKGITQSVLSEYVNETRRMTEDHARVIAHVLGVRPRHLGRRITKEELVILLDNTPSHLELAAALDSVGGVVSAGSSESPVRHLRAVDDYEVDPDLDCISSIRRDDTVDQVAIPIWPESVAATDYASNDATHDSEMAYVPASMKKLYGAKLRAIRVAGRSMVKAGILPGSVLFVRKSSSCKDGDIVIVSDHGGMTVKRRRGQLAVPESDEHFPTLTLGEDAILQGVVHAIYRPRRT